MDKEFLLNNETSLIQLLLKSNKSSIKSDSLKNYEITDEEILHSVVSKLEILENIKNYINSRIIEIENSEWDDVYTSQELRILRNLQKMFYKEGEEEN